MSVNKILTYGAIGAAVWFLFFKKSGVAKENTVTGGTETPSVQSGVMVDPIRPMAETDLI